MSMKHGPPKTPLLYRKIGVYTGIHFFLIFALELKSNSHAPNLLATIIYSRVNKVRVYYFAHANANTHGT